MTEKERFIARFEAKWRQPDDHHFNIEGKSISMAEWAWLFQDKNYQVVVQTRKRGIMVSTVWLGLDHGFSYREPHVPIIFETMIFGGWFSDGNEWQVRYATLDQAIAGHRQACAFAFGWRSRLREIRRAWTPDIPMPPLGRWKPPASYARPWDKDYKEPAV